MDTGDDVDIVVVSELNRKGADVAGTALDNDAPRFARRSVVEQHPPCGRLYRPRPPYGAELTFQFRTVPLSSLRCCRIRALEKIHQDRRRVGRGAHGIVWQNEFAELWTEERLLRPNRRGSEILGWRVGVGIKRRVVD
jgi:hypothetical protein